MEAIPRPYASTPHDVPPLPPAHDQPMTPERRARRTRGASLARRRARLTVLPVALVMLAAAAMPGSAAAGRGPAPLVNEEITKLLDTQVAAWNRGDLDGFCSAYSDDATFLSTKGLTKGRRALLERYRQRYPDRAAMGTLTLDLRETRTVEWGWRRGKAYTASIIASWKLSYPDRADASGYTLLVLQRSGDTWRIVQDASM